MTRPDKPYGQLGTCPGAPHPKGHHHVQTGHHIELHKCFQIEQDVMQRPKSQESKVKICCLLLDDYSDKNSKIMFKQHWLRSPLLFYNQELTLVLCGELRQRSGWPSPKLRQRQWGDTFILVPRTLPREFQTSKACQWTSWKCLPPCPLPPAVTANHKVPFKHRVGFHWAATSASPQ